MIVMHSCPATPSARASPVAAAPRVAATPAAATLPAPSSSVRRSHCVAGVGCSTPSALGVVRSVVCMAGPPLAGSATRSRAPHSTQRGPTVGCNVGRSAPLEVLACVVDAVAHVVGRVVDSVLQRRTAVARILHGLVGFLARPLERALLLASA